jgi:hypothetical protein
MAGDRDGEYIYLIYDDGDPDYEVVRGHVSDDVARAAVQRETGWPRDGDPHRIVQGWARWTPAPQDGLGDLTFHHVPAPGPGAFAVTYVEPVVRRADSP